jgi:hypothetical protein
MGKEPRKVNAVPQGYEFSHRDEATGRDIYKIKTETKPARSSTITKTTSTPAVKKTASTSVLKAPIKRKTPPTVTEDFVYIEPTVTDSIPKEPIKIYEDLRIDRKLQPPINPNIDYYKYPDPNAGYSKSTPMYFDKTTQRPVDVLKSIGADGTYNPIYTDTLTVNEGKYQGTIKQGNPRVTTDPTKTNILPGNEIDKSGTKKGEIVGTTGFKKGGIVSKIKGYANGGEVRYNYKGEVIDEDGNVVEKDTLTNDEIGKQVLGLVDNSLSTLSKAKSSQGGGQEATTTEGATDSTTSTPTDGAQAVGGASKSAGKAGLYSAIGNIGAAGAGIGAGVIDSKMKDERGRYKSVESSVASNTLKGAAIGTKIGANPMLAGATGGLSVLGGALLGAGGGAIYGNIKGKKDTRAISDSEAKRAAELSSANTESALMQAINNRNANIMDPTVLKPYTEKTAMYDENDNLINQYAKGGVIKGPGGPTDDLKKGKVKAGSFVVPADNAKVAETLREKLLMKAPKMKADLNQKGGEDVMLSNGEHLFTPEEKHELIEKGVNIDALAPESKVKAMEKKSHIMFPSFAKGGKVDDNDEIVANSKKVIEAQKEVSKLEKELNDFKKDRKVTDNNESTKKLNDKIENDKLGYLNKAKGVLKDKVSLYESAKNRPKLEVFNPKENKPYKDNVFNKTTKQVGDVEKALVKRKKDLLKEYADIKKDADSGNTIAKINLQKKTIDIGKEIANVDKLLNENKKTKAVEDNESTKTSTAEVKPTATEVNATATTVAPKAEVKPTVAITKPSLKAPVVKKKEVVSPFTVNANPDEEVIVPNGQLSPNEVAAINSSSADAKIQADALNKSLPQSVDVNNAPQNKRRGLADVLNKFDPTVAVGIGQMILGKRGLKGQERPVDNAVIDPTYNEAVNRSIEDAKFGLTSEQNFMANQDINNARRDAMAKGVNYAGGSGVQAFNLNRAAINDAWKNKLGLNIANQEARIAKQKYADAMAADRAGILASNRRQAFNDAMYTFQQKQKAGSELVGAGLQNIIGAYRFNQDQKAMEKANAERNAWTRNI